jgi:hypothetical protein
MLNRTRWSQGLLLATAPLLVIGCSSEDPNAAEQNAEAVQAVEEGPAEATDAMAEEVVPGSAVEEAAEDAAGSANGDTQASGGDDDEEWVPD